MFSTGYTPEAAIHVTPLGPLKMLVSDHRGLFVWSPVSLLALAGYVRLLRKRPDERPFLAIGGAMAVLLLLAYAAVPFWDGGWSFSQRYLTPFYPLVAIGLSGLVEWRRAPVVAAATLAAAWSVFLGLNHVFGVKQSDGALEVAGYVTRGERTPGQFFDLVRAYSRLKYLF